MDSRIRRYGGAALLALALAACGQDQAEAEPVTPENTTLLSPLGPASADYDAPSLTPEAEKGEEGARNLLLAWARAIEANRPDEAWSLFDTSAREQMPEEEFAAMFDGLREIAVAVPDGEMEGAAVSLYYMSQATITAMGTDGQPVRLEGPVVLRRVNDVPGASEEQLRWNVERVELTAMH